MNMMDDEKKDTFLDNVNKTQNVLGSSAGSREEKTRAILPTHYLTEEKVRRKKSRKQGVVAR